jgi:hypothetical protein
MLGDGTDPAGHPRSHSNARSHRDRPAVLRSRLLSVGFGDLQADREVVGEPVLVRVRAYPQRAGFGVVTGRDGVSDTADVRASRHSVPLPTEKPQGNTVVPSRGLEGDCDVDGAVPDGQFEILRV